MLGNDVVDLADAEAAHAACHPRFDARVFGERERRRLETAEDPLRMRWILWAAKESAYKAARRRDPSVIFSPRRFEVQLDASLRGRVRYPGGVLAVRVELFGNCLHALAAAAPWEPEMLLWGVAAVENGDASERVRALAVGALAPHLDTAAGALSIRGVGRIPQLFVYEVATDHPLSLAHHGHFAAWACALRPGAARAATAALEGAT
jgi:phosphopantetheinyl transferase (holo-ACP synthase)